MFLGALGAVFVVLFLTGVVPPDETTTTVAPTTTEPPPSAEIEFFRPISEVGDDGCVELEWSVADAESVQLETPQDGTATVEAEDQRSVCGSDGDAIVLTASGADGGQDMREYVISFELSVGEPTVEVSGRTLIVDVVTNQPASVTVAAADSERTSSGTTNHHLELDDLPSGEVDWDLTASAPDQLDITRSGSVDVSYYYGRLTVVERPQFISTQTTTTTSAPATTTPGPVLTFILPEFEIALNTSWHYVFSTDPVYRFLDDDECPDVDGETVEELIFPLEMDGSGEPSVSVFSCSTLFESPFSSLEEAEVETKECELEAGFAPTTIECTLQYEREQGYVEMTVQVERLVSGEEPDYN